MTGTNTAKTMAEILAEHYPIYRWKDGYGNVWACTSTVCGKWVESFEAAITHQADALSAAGFGLVADAKAEALEEASNDMDGLELLSGYPEESCNDEENAAVEAYDNAANNQEWLRARAAALRGDS